MADSREIHLNQGDYIEEVKGNVNKTVSYGDGAQQQINAQSFAEGITPQSSKEDVAKLLALVRAELAQSALPEALQEDVAHEIEGAEKKLQRDAPDKPAIAKKLKEATGALEESAKTVKAAAAIGNLLGKAILWCGLQWMKW